MREDSGRGWRKVVPSPRPIRVLGVESIASILQSCNVLVAAGGGGIPVVRGRDGQWRGIEAVIDKDYASALLAADLGAELFIILTGVDRVSLDFGTPEERKLDRLSVADAERQMADGQFPAGSMGPKIEAAIDFVKRTGREVLITDVEHLREALDGAGGTRIVP